MISYEDIFGKPDEKAMDAGVPDVSSGDGILRTWEQCQEWAEKIGCDIVEAKANQLFIDIDTEAQFAQFEFQLLKEHFYFTKITITPSKQGLPRRHIVIEMGKEYPLITRIALQAILGSDPTRELISIKRALEDESNVVIFFEKKATA